MPMRCQHGHSQSRFAPKGSGTVESHMHFSVPGVIRLPSMNLMRAAHEGIR
jgi:hypothetical protein